MKKRPSIIDYLSGIGGFTFARSANIGSDGNLDSTNSGNGGDNTSIEQSLVEGDVLYFKRIGATINDFDQELSKEIIRHIEYLANKAGVTSRHIIDGLPFSVPRQVHIDAINNINAVISVDCTIIKDSSRKAQQPSPPPTQEAANLGERCTFLGDGKLLVRANWGGYMVVPSFNVDVAIGLVRDGVIEPWTTKLVQELTKPGDKVLNAGANFGYYVSLAGNLVGAQGKVYAVEANPHIIPYLLLTKYWSGLAGRVEIYNAALWDKAAETAKFLFDPQFLGGGGVSDKSVSVKDFSSAIWSASSLECLTSRGGKVEEARGCFVSLDVTTTTIDTVVGDDVLDLIHLDAEGAEAFALLGAKEVIARSPGLRIVTEWWGPRIPQNSKLRDASTQLWDLLTSLGFRVRHVETNIEPDGGIVLSQPLAMEFMMNDAPHGDYVWLRPQHDRWT